MFILGINAYHGDSSACLFADGKLVAAVEEERFNRVKHWAGFPAQSIQFCLQMAEVELDAVDVIAVNRDPNRYLGKKIGHILKYRPGLGALFDRIKNRGKMMDLGSDFQKEFHEVPKSNLNIVNVEHHEAHLASAFFVSPFDRAAILSVDGFGDFSSVALGVGEGNTIKVLKRIYFPHSLGLFYTAITQYLGYPRYGDEYKMMGLAAYGEPDLVDKLKETLHLEGDGDFRLNMRYFLHHLGKVDMTWDNCEPTMGTVFSSELEKLLGPVRKNEEDFTDYHRALAASAQELYEGAFFNILKELYKLTGQDNLCLAGGCAFNSLANGRIFERSSFKNVYIQPAAGDAGGAIGAAARVQHAGKGLPRSFEMKHGYWGPGFDEQAILETLQGNNPLQQALSEGVMRLTKLAEEQLLEDTAESLTQGDVVGWFQGRSEWGPRALGNRSILVDPRRPDMKELLNTKIKRRESFRPFAPSILRENVGEYFETEVDVPFMQQVFKIRQEKRDLLPSVTHVDGTGRLQTVTEDQNGLYYRLIKRFGEKTGVPVVLNTSFNENEPIVNRPEEALDCFLRTKMDLLVMGPYMLRRTTC
jgi:carbamoyltransferase